MAGCIVRTKQELKRAIEARRFPITCKGAIAQELVKKKSRSKKAMIGGGLLAAAGLAGIPFTGGGSAAVVGAGLTATALTVGSVVISTAELAILVGGGVAIVAILKGRKVTIINHNPKTGETTVKID